MADVDFVGYLTRQIPFSAIGPSFCVNKAGQTVWIIVAPFLEYTLNQSLFINWPPRGHAWAIGGSWRAISQFVSTSFWMYGLVDLGVIRKGVSLLITSFCTRFSNIFNEKECRSFLCNFFFKKKYFARLLTYKTNWLSECKIFLGILNLILWIPFD